MATMSRNLVGLIISAGVIVAAPLLGLAVTVLFLQGTFKANTSADPSQKARLLAEGISGAMNATAFGLIVGVLAIIPTIVFAVRLYRESKPKA
jgi:biopolymer transport protein ExbB/TolQ